jgi:hypothetical protein
MRTRIPGRCSADRHALWGNTMTPTLIMVIACVVVLALFVTELIVFRKDIF